MGTPLYDVGAILTVILGFGLIGYSIYGMITGIIRIKGAIIVREENPRFYWALIGIWIAVGIIFLISYFVFGHLFRIYTQLLIFLNTLQKNKEKALLGQALHLRKIPGKPKRYFTRVNSLSPYPFNSTV